MANYYEMLKIQPAATSAEITEAIEAQYNQWRRLVTHHDPNIVNQANQALAKLEQIRTTLTDPAKRGIYDAAIEVHGPTAGLADPEAVLRDMPAAAAMTPPARIAAGRVTAPLAQRAAATSSLWASPKCQTETPPMSEHCFKCGTQLLRICPECGGMTSLISTGVCGKCGYRYERAVQRKELKQQISLLQGQQQNLGAELTKTKSIPLGASGCQWVFQIIFTVGLYLGGLYAFTVPYQSYQIWGFIALILAVFATISVVSAFNKKKKTEAAIFNLEQSMAQKQSEIDGTQKMYNELTR
jgi:hypothetical protein